MDHERFGQEFDREVVRIETSGGRRRREIRVELRVVVFVVVVVVVVVLSGWIDSVGELEVCS